MCLLAESRYQLYPRILKMLPKITSTLNVYAGIIFMNTLLKSQSPLKKKVHDDR